FSSVLRHARAPVLEPLSLPDALPVSRTGPGALPGRLPRRRGGGGGGGGGRLASGVPRPLASAVRRGPARASRSFAPAALRMTARSEEHTSELQSRFDLVCRLLLEKKK